MTDLGLPEGGRAASLLARLDAAWFRFVAALPPPLHAGARRASTYTGVQPGQDFRGPSSMNPGITCTPWLFWELVCPLDDDSIVELALGGGLVVLASVLLDHLVDGQAERPAEAALLRQALFEGGSARFRARLAADSGFWDAFDRLGAEHVAGLAQELEFRSRPEPVDQEAFDGLVERKFSPIVITMAAFCHLLDRPQWLVPIEASIKHLAVASQLLDDVGDWEEDLAGRHLTYFLSLLAPPEAWRAPRWPAAGELRQRIDEDWLDIEAMARVQRWLDRSLQAVEGLDCPGWRAYLGGYRALAEQHLARFKARHLLRAIEPLLDPAAGGSQGGEDTP